MHRIFIFSILALALPTLADAQSLEWLAEHSSSTATTTVQISSNTNDGLEARVSAYFAHEPIMIEIARCESRFRQFDSTGKTLDGGAGGMMGLFQINADVHASYAASIGMDINAVDGNLAYAKRLHETEGTTPWISSFSCWGASQESSTTDASVSTPTLSFGMENAHVLELQRMLNSSGYRIAESGPGSPGQETQKFGTLTRAAMRAFQCAKLAICSGDEYTTSWGVYGPRTRAVLVSAQSSIPQTPANDTSAEIARLTKLIAELSAQLALLRQSSR